MIGGSLVTRSPCAVVLSPCRAMRTYCTAVVYDINGREAVEVEPVIAGTKRTLEQYIYCSSAGVYLKSGELGGVHSGALIDGACDCEAA